METPSFPEMGIHGSCASGPRTDFLRGSIRGLSELLFPSCCVICGRAIVSIFGTPPGHHIVCQDCENDLRPIAGRRCRACGRSLISEEDRCLRCRGREWAFDEALPIFAYEGSVASLVLAYKIGGRRSLASFFAARLALEIAGRWSDRTLVPVPARREKLREKGWEQMEEIVRILSRKGFPVSRCLERLPSLEQKKLGLADRFENARAAYRVRAGAFVPARIVLLDDVFTTGSTLDACANALKGHGAKAISALTVATD